MKINIKKIDFVYDNKIIKAVLHLPDIKKPPLVVGSHGLEGSKESAKQKLLANLLSKHGIAFLRFDHRGCGESQGSFQADTSLIKRVQDMVYVIEQTILLKFTDERIFLFGSSLGGATCILSWHMLAEKSIFPYGAVLCAAPVKSAGIQNIPLDGNDKRPSLPLSFFKENLLFDLSDKLSLLKNIMIFHGDKDLTVPVENAYNIYDNVRDPKKLIILKNGDHRMSSEKDQEKFELEALSWIKKSFSLKN